MASIAVPSTTICTAATRGKQYLVQPVFECKPCNQIVCGACWQRCHGSHTTIPRGVANAFCDCGTGRYCFANSSGTSAGVTAAANTPFTSSTGTTTSNVIPPSQPHVCTYTQHGPKHYIQPLFECVTCNMVGSSCVCRACVSRCHAGHVVKFKSSNRAGYCDCGSATPNRCASTVPPPPQLQAKLERLCTLSQTGTSYMAQPAYACVQCNLVGTSICCATCAVVCHSHQATGGQNARLITPSSNAYCDCCSVSTSGCQALPPPWREPWKHLPAFADMKEGESKLEQPSSSSSAKTAAPMPTSSSSSPSLVPKPAPPMPSSSVSDLLTSCGLAEYIPIFASNEIDMDTLKILDDESLALLIPKVGPRAKLRAALGSRSPTSSNINSSPAAAPTPSQPVIPPGHVIYKQLLTTVSKDKKITDRDLELLQRMRTDYHLSIADHLQLMHDCGITQEQFEQYKAAAQAESKAAAASPPAEEKATCVVCLDEPANHVIVPCGHICLCGSCASQFKNGACPTCRGSVQQLVKVFT